MTPLSSLVRHTFRFCRVVVWRCSPAQDAKQQKRQQRRTCDGLASGTSRINDDVAARTKLTTNIGMDKVDEIGYLSAQCNGNICFASRSTDNVGLNRRSPERAPD